jgi:hypothetical protein
VVRILACWILLAAVVAAEEKPLLRATGDSLANFKIVTRLDGVDRSSPEALAKSFVRLQLDQRLVQRRFRERFRAAHVTILRRYYSDTLVAAQKQRYEKTTGNDADASCRIGDIKGDFNRVTALLEWDFRDDVTGRRVSKKIRLTLVRRVETWWILVIHDSDPDRGWVPRKLGVPADVPPAKAAQVTKSDRSAPKKAIRALEREVRRLKAVGDQGRHAMAKKFFDILAAFYGEEAAERARQDRPKPASYSGTTFNIQEPEPAKEGQARIDVMIMEPVPGMKDTRSAIGNAAFELLKGEDGWRVVREFIRPQPDQEFVPVTENFALFFHLR